MKQKTRRTGFLLPAVLLLTCTELRAQFDTLFLQNRVRSCADSLASGFKTRNWELFARYSNPAIIGTMGGKAEFINFVTSVFGQIPDSAWKEYKPGNVLQLIKTEKDFQAVLELHSLIEWEGRRIKAVNHLIAQSWDGGFFWTFFDSQNNEKAAREIKPDLSPDLIIPPKTPEEVQLLVPPKQQGSPVKAGQVRTNQ